MCEQVCLLNLLLWQRLTDNGGRDHEPRPSQTLRDLCRAKPVGVELDAMPVSIFAADALIAHLESEQ